MILARTIACRSSNLEEEIQTTKKSNSKLREEVIALQGQKNLEFTKAQHGLDRLERKLRRNRELHAEMKEAEQKLKLTKRLIAKHQQIVQDLEMLKQRFPELTSGQ